MANEKTPANGNVGVWLIPANDLTDFRSPAAAEVNTNGLNVTAAVAWDGTTWPGNTESNDIDDRSLLDQGNATSRGFAQFEGTLSFFRPKPGDTASIAAQAWDLLRSPRVDLFVITRVLQGTTGQETDLAAGQWINVYKFITDTVNDDTEGEDSYKFIVGLMPQGQLAVQTQGKNAGPVVTEATGSTSLSVGDHLPLRATLGGHRATQAVTWVSSDQDVALVSTNGVVTAVSEGSADITATHDAATGASTPIAITVS